LLSLALSQEKAAGSGNAIMALLYILNSTTSTCESR
jgi:hypothetical protein